MKNLVYQISSRFCLTAGITKRIEHKVYLLYPSTKYSVIKKTQRYLIRMYIIILFIMAALFAFTEISLYYSCLAGIVAYVIADSYINTALSRQELKLLEYFEEFINELHFNYQFNNMLIYSFEKAIEKVPYDMAIHGEIMLSSLKGAETGGGDDYREIAPDNLFLTLYSLSLTVLHYGDKVGKQGSIYLDNLGYLKENVNIEILKRKKMGGKFMGLSAVTILPVFFIKIIEMWGISNMPELKAWYNGFWGMVTTIILSLVTMAIYKIIAVLKNPYHTEVYKSNWAERLLEYDIINACIIKFINRTYKRSENLNKLLKSLVYPYNIKEFILRRIFFSVCVGIMTFVIGKSIGIKLYAAVLISIFAAGMMYIMIYLRLMIKKQMMIMDSEEEIVRYQSVILMLMHMDRMSIEQILGQIMDFAVIFKTEVENMINQFSYIGMKVFEKAKENTGSLPFEKLMDAFLATDALGIEIAFKSMEEDRRYYIEKHRQENEQIIEKKSAVGKTLAFIPLCMVILVKLILPFVLEGMKQLSNTGL